ncbi:MAG TPA: AAA family ATPase [Gemmata sp.]|jgi:predicted ATPase|nr:AAA family ATPase [Gemmata sp.]
MSSAATDETDDSAIIESKPPFLRRVRIRGYKSIAFCDVTLEPLTILVGRNASGKSNFVDALAFLADAMRLNLTEAVYRHGGPTGILCRTSGTRRIEFELECFEDNSGNHELITYQLNFSIAEDGTLQGPGEILNRRIIADTLQDNSVKPRFQTTSKQLEWISHHSPYHLSLAASGEPSAPYLSERIASFRVYNLNPEIMRTPQRVQHVGFLERDGSNFASVIQTMTKIDKNAVERVGRYLSAVTRSVTLLGITNFGDYETVKFRVNRGDDEQVLEFDAANMSDGTLRIIGSLVAAYQSMPSPYGSPSLIAIEEPETALHPAAMRALVDALDEATLRTQILLTTHSAEMLDNPTIRPENIRAVQMIDGQTVIGPVDEASVEIVQRKLSTLGALERENQLEPDFNDLERQRLLSHNGRGPKE